MRKSISKAMAALAFAALLTGGVVAQEGSPDMLGALKEAANQKNYFVPMRDGARMWTSIFFPKGHSEPLPTLLVRTPYRFDDELYFTSSGSMHLHYLNQGYALAFQHERGHFWSEGEYRYNVGAGKDGYDTVDWIAGQSWSNGRVGSLGCSSSGDNQVGLSSANHPAHRAALIMSVGSAVGPVGPFHDPGLFYRGGVVQMPWAGWHAVAGQRYFPKFPADAPPAARDWMAQAYNNWPSVSTDSEDIVQTLPLMNAVSNTGHPHTDYDKYIRRFPGDPAWKEEEQFQSGDPFGTPALWVFQLHDISGDQNMALFEHLLARRDEGEVDPHQKMIISPLDHCSMMQETENSIAGEREVGDARFDYLKVTTDWFDYWLKGKKNDSLGRPVVEVYMPGRNEWLQFQQWPPANLEAKKYFLGSATGRAIGRGGDGVLSLNPQQAATRAGFVYDPAQPFYTVGGDICCVSENYQAGSFDYSKLPDRDDVLTFTSDPLTAGIDVLGWVEATLYVSSDAPDTDFTIKLFDVYPDGRAYNLKDVIQRARWRDGYDKERFMKPGKVYKVKVGPMFVSNNFAPGHRIRLDISSSNFPRYARNLNTGGNNFDEKEGRVAHNAIHMSNKHPSHFVLPINDR